MLHSNFGSLCFRHDFRMMNTFLLNSLCVCVCVVNVFIIDHHPLSYFIDVTSSKVYCCPANPSQMRMAEITEMIHTASLLHDDVIDMSDVRRGVASVNSSFGNKLAVLAGDFLLARASVCLARLRSVEAMEIMSIVIEQVSVSNLALALLLGAPMYTLPSSVVLH